MDMLLWIGLGVAVVAAGGVFWFVRSRPKREEPYFHFNCSGCGRRLRYKAKQAGHAGMCPQCNRPLTFPAVPRSGV